MGETRQPHTPYLVFVFFFTLSFATRTTGSVNCQTDPLPYPFGFSDRYPIRFSCSKNGSAEIGEFAVEEVTDANIYVHIPTMCRIEQLYGDNFAPSNIQNTILVQGCKESSYSNPRLIIKNEPNLGRCNSSWAGCFDVVTTTTADVMSIGDVVNRTGCKYWLSSITSDSMNTTSGISLNFGRLKLDWWLKEGCSNAICSENAICTQVKLPGGGLGHRCTCVDRFRGDALTVHGGCRLGSRNKGISTRAKIGSGAGVIMFMFLVLTLFLQILRKRKRKTSHDLSQQNLKALIPRQNVKAPNPQQDLKALIPLKQYSYAQVKRITKSFAQVVGKGGFGTVYRGTLCDARSVAVKVLKDSKGNNSEDFINEVASISQTSHVNIVTLLGFCSEGSKRAILYEFLQNGSLDKFISSKRSSNMDWTALYRIALGVARGLDYLHHGCRTRIVHFDIKPQNVLLDDNFCPKVSDFGLAKLCKREESILSLLDTRGTIGYIAPEVFSRVYGRVSPKSDVYSYGMLVLEMIGARTKPSTEDTASSTSSMYFPEWIYKNLEKGGNVRLIENGINSEEEEIAKKMTLVGMWCIQSWPTDRPPMNRVVEMMEGNLNALELPPRPVFQIPAAPLQESSTLSEDMSGYTEVCSMNITWLKEGCSNVTCSVNANCTQVKLPRGGLGHWCTCLDGFRGDAFTGGC